MISTRDTSTIPESIWLDQPLELVEHGSIVCGPNVFDWSIYSDWSGSSALLLHGVPPTTATDAAKEVARLLFSERVVSEGGREVEVTIKGGGHMLQSSSSASMWSRCFKLGRVVVGYADAPVDYFEFYIVGFHWLNNGIIDLDFDDCKASLFSVSESELSNEHAHVFLKNNFSCILRVSTDDKKKASRVCEAVVLSLSIVCGTQVSSTASVGIDGNTEQHSMLTLVRVMGKPFHGVPLVDRERIPSLLHVAAQKIFSLDDESARFARRVVSLFVESVNQAAFIEVRCLIACMTVEEFVHKLFRAASPQSVKATAEHKRALKTAAAAVCEDLPVSDDVLDEACESFWKVAKSKTHLDIFSCAQSLGADISEADAIEFVGFRNALVHDRDPRSNRKVNLSFDKASILESYRRVLLIMDKLIIGYFCSAKPDVDRGMLIKNGGLDA